jgi:arylsulfatase A-like enzyme
MHYCHPVANYLLVQGMAEVIPNLMSDKGLPRDVWTLPQMLHHEGYQTALIGKCEFHCWWNDEGDAMKRNQTTRILELYPIQKINYPIKNYQRLVYCRHII